MTQLHPVGAILVISGVVFFGGIKPGWAQEPLWGVSAQTYAYDVIKAQIDVNYQNRSSLYNHSSPFRNPLADRLTRTDATASIQYGAKAGLNFKLEIPFSQVQLQELRVATTRRSAVSGIGDIVFSAKKRISVRFTPRGKIQQAAIVGIRLPTGVHSGHATDVSVLPASDQPGTGNWGGLVGYAFDYNRVQDSLNVSATYGRDLLGSTGEGFAFNFDSSYGRWLRRAPHPKSLGLFLSAGPHLEMTGEDRLHGRLNPLTGWTKAGIQTMFLAAKGQSEFKTGFFIPLYQYFNNLLVPSQLAYPIEWRMGAEILF